MKDIKTSLRQRLSQKNLSHLGIGAFLIQQCKQKCAYPEELTGYVRHNRLSLKLDPREDKMKWFMTRVELKDELNIVLKEFGYTYILQDIKIR